MACTVTIWNDDFAGSDASVRREGGVSSAEERLTKAIAAHPRESLVTKHRIVADAIARLQAPG